MKTCKLCCLSHSNDGDYCSRKTCLDIRIQSQLAARARLTGRYLVQCETYDATIERERFNNWNDALTYLDNSADYSVSAFILDTQTGQSYEPHDINNCEGM